MDKAFEDLFKKEEAKRVSPEWKVYFDGNFWGHYGRDHAGREIRLNREFDWGGYPWIIPAAYSCSRGLVVDFCMRVGVEEILRFLEKWNLDPENDQHRDFTQEEQMKVDLDNPLCFDYIPGLEVNGKTLRASRGCSVVFNPCLSEERIDERAKWVRGHYGLDQSFGWTIWRWVFPWSGKSRPEIRSISLKMEQRLRRVPGPHFKVHGPGDTFMFSHPVNGTKYTLTVQDLEQQTVPEEHFDSRRWRYPTHFMVMRYTISPEADKAVLVCDCDQSDQPLEIAPDTDPSGPKDRKSVAVSIIGGTDGPTAIAVGGSEHGKVHTACSALHFEPVRNDAIWRLDFNIKDYEGIVVELL